MAPYTPPEALRRAQHLYSSAHNGLEPSDADIVAFVQRPDQWAEQAIRLGWTYPAAEAVVRSCRILRKRVLLALEATSA
jgi:hypothetical protein